MKIIDKIKEPPHYLPHYLKRKNYSTGIYTGYDKRVLQWSKMTKKQKTEALNKEWYVRWSYRNPVTEKMDRQDNIYGNANSFDTRVDRMEILKTLERNLCKLLDTGFSPYEQKEEPQQTISVFEAIDKAMDIKALHMAPESFTRYKSDINKLKEHLKQNGYENRFITSLKKKTITNYLNDQLKTVSSRTRNNYRLNISSLWQCMVDEGFVETNFVESIPVLKTVPKRNKTFTDSQVSEIFEYLQAHDPRLLLVIELVSYNFLRPKEVCRLKVGSFNIPEKSLTVHVKKGREKTYRIPNIMLSRLPDMTGIDPNTDLIGKQQILENWPIAIESKRGRLSDAFREVKKQFQLGPEYGIYSFRHYFITRLYRNLRKDFSPFETKSKLMLITGHSSMQALEKYLRTIDAELPKDYSDRIK